jgi:hypothetical protein
MKKFKNNLSRNEMRTIFAGGGKGPVPIAPTPECGEICGGDSGITCGSTNTCSRCVGGKCSE